MDVFREDKQAWNSKNISKAIHLQTPVIKSTFSWRAIKSILPVTVLVFWSGLWSTVTQQMQLIWGENVESIALMSFAERVKGIAYRWCPYRPHNRGQIFFACAYFYLWLYLRISEVNCNFYISKLGIPLYLCPLYHIKSPLSWKLPRNESHLTIWHD